MAGTQKPSKTATATTETPSTVRVRATRLGYHAHVRRRPGDVFTVPTSVFSERWMERVDDRTPEHQTSPQAALNQRMGDIRGGRAGGETGSDADDES